MARIYVHRKPDGSYSLRGERRVGKMLLGVATADAQNKRGLQSALGAVLQGVGLEGEKADVTQAPASIRGIES